MHSAGRRRVRPGLPNILGPGCRRVPARHAAAPAPRQPPPLRHGLRNAPPKALRHSHRRSQPKSSPTLATRSIAEASLAPLPRNFRQALPPFAPLHRHAFAPDCAPASLPPPRLASPEPSLSSSPGQSNFSPTTPAARAHGPGALGLAHGRKHHQPGQHGHGFAQHPGGQAAHRRTAQGPVVGLGPAPQAREPPQCPEKRHSPPAPTRPRRRTHRRRAPKNAAPGPEACPARQPAQQPIMAPANPITGKTPQPPPET